MAELPAVGAPPGPGLSAPARPPLVTVDLDRGGTDDVLDVLPDEPLTEAEAGYARAARSANTLRGYRSDWAEFTAWCRAHALQPLPVTPATLTGYLTELAAAGAKVGTMARRLSSIRFAHAAHDPPDPTAAARVRAVWEGIRRVHGAPPEQAKPLMPPELFDLLDACPVTKTWKTRGRAPEPDLAGARDRGLLLVGFVGALRRSELAALDVDDVAEHVSRRARQWPGPHPEPLKDEPDRRGGRAGRPAPRRQPRPLSGHRAADLARPGLHHRRPGVPRRDQEQPALPRGLHPESVNDLVRAAAARAGLTEGISAHSLRAGFVTFAHLRGASDRAIAHQTRHRSLATLGTYVRVQQAWTDNAATILGL